MSATQDLNDPNLFKDNPPGEYTYSETSLGKTASGQLSLSDDPQRDAEAQRSAGGEDRRVDGGFWGKDDGGHLIGARFGGATDDRNLTPQNSNLNRGGYKRAENSWAEHLEAGDKVYVHMESYTGGDSQRPSAYMGYAIIEHTDENGQTSRQIEYYSMNNESRATHEALDEEMAQFEAEHPEYTEQTAAENTVMPYIWDEETGDVVENPHYDPSVEEDYTPEETQEASEAAENYAPAEAAEESAETAEDYAPAETTAEVSDTSEITEDYAPAEAAGTAEVTEDYTPAEAAPENTETQSYAPESAPSQSTEADHSSSADNSQGQDV